jgi:hypothetical protein
MPAFISEGNAPIANRLAEGVYKKKKNRTDKKKGNWGTKNCSLLLNDLTVLNMVVATETGEGDMATVVGSMYDGHFGRVWGYTNHSVKLTLVHGLAQPWAKETANVRVTVRKSSVRVLNLNEVKRVATWEEGVMTRKEGRSRAELYLGDDDISGAFRQVNHSPGPEAELLAKLVALHINTHPAGVNKGCLAFQEKLNGAMVQGPLNE